MSRTYCEVFDAYFDPESRVWLEKTCGNEDGLCPYCPGRPAIHPFDCSCLDEHPCPDCSNEMVACVCMDK